MNEKKNESVGFYVILNKIQLECRLSILQKTIFSFKKWCRLFSKRITVLNVEWFIATIKVVKISAYCSPKIAYCYAHWQSTKTKNILGQDHMAFVTGPSLDHLKQTNFSTLSQQDRQLNLFLLFPNRRLQSCSRIY